MSAPFWVYIAGPLSGPPGVYLANVSQMSLTSRDLMDVGFCPINPSADMLEGLMYSQPITDAAYKLRSMQLLQLLEGRRAALFVVKDKHRDGSVSVGVAAEIAEAERLGIPVCRHWWELEDLRGDE